MSLGIGIGIGVDRGGGGGTEAAIRALFAAGEQGVWFDPSQLATQYQDSIGVTPVTAVEQPVGLILDKRLGAVRSGSELITNGTFDTNTTGWTATNSTLSVDTQRLKITNVGAVYGAAHQGFAAVVGKFYEITADFTVGTASAMYLNIGATAGNPEYGQVTRTTSGVMRAIVKAVGTTIYAYFSNETENNVHGFIDNVSAKLLDGNHATQATSAARSVLSARVNLLTKTEQLNVAADWVVNGGQTITANGMVAPDGTTTAETTSSAVGTLYNGYGTIANGPFVVSFYVKPTDPSLTEMVFLDGGAVAGSVCYCLVVPSTGVVSGIVGADFVSAGSESIGDGWYRLHMKVNATGTGGLFAHVYPQRATLTGWWGWQLERGSTLTRYQRVNTATDYDTAGFPHYLKPDGVDDSMTTAAIDFSATDKMTVWAGVRKLSDATQGMIFELNSAAAAGTFFLVAPDAVAATDYRAQLQGASGTAKVVSAAAAAPITNVLAAQYDIAAAALSEVVLRLNGVAGGTASGNATTGNFGNYALHMFRRGGATLPFGGHFYGGIVRGAASTAAQLSTVERYLAAKSGVTL